MARKRAPGAGRKPQGEFSGKSSAFATRITPETRTALERMAKSSGRSISQVAEDLLRRGLRFRENEDLSYWRGEHLYALGRLIAYAAAHLEAVLDLASPIGGKHWRDDPFAARALPVALSVILQELNPGSVDAQVEIPEVATRYAEHMARARGNPSSDVEKYSTPEAFGTMIGMKVILDLNTYTVGRPSKDPDDESAAVIDMDVANFMPALRQCLGLNTKKRGKRK